MKKIIPLTVAALMTFGTAHADGHGKISEFRIGILGGENAQDRLCLLYTSPSPRDSR